MPLSEMIGMFLIALLGGVTAGITMILVVGLLVKRYASSFMGGMMGGLGQATSGGQGGGGLQVVQDDEVPDAPSSVAGEEELDGVSEWENLVEDDE